GTLRFRCKRRVCDVLSVRRETGASWIAPPQRSKHFDRTVAHGDPCNLHRAVAFPNPNEQTPISRPSRGLDVFILGAGWDEDARFAPRRRERDAQLTQSKNSVGGNASCIPTVGHLTGVR